MKINSNTLILILIIALSFGVRIIGINHGLPDINRFFWETDEAATVNISMGMGSGDLNPHSFNKPSLVYYITFLFYGIFYLIGRLSGFFSSPVQFAVYYLHNTYWFYLIARGIALVFGVLTVYMTYILGKKSFGDKVGILGASLIAVVPLHITYSRLALSDGPALFFLLVATYYIISVLDTDSTRSYILSGLFSGLAASTKYHAGFIWFLVPFLFIFNLATRKSANYKGLLFSLLFLISGFFIGTPYAVIDFKTFIVSLKALASVKTVSVGFIPNWWFVHLKQFWQVDNFGPALLVLSIIGIIYAILKHTKKDIIFLITILVFYVFFSLPNIAWSPLHYLLPIMPILCILSSRFVNLWLSRKLVLYSFIGFVIIPVLFLDIKNGFTLLHHDTKYYARLWVEKNIPARSTILTDGYYIPQLTLTEDSLERLGKLMSRKSVLLPKRGEVLEMNLSIRSRLKSEKIKSLTQIGIPYNIYFIYDTSLFLQNKDITIADYIEKYGIQYVLLSEEGKKTYLFECNLFSGYKTQLASFYNSLPEYTVKLKDFMPQDWKVPGSRISIYKIEKQKH